LKTAIYNRLNDDATLAGILTGGVYHDIAEITRQGATGAFDDNQEIKPCGLIKLSSESPTGPYWNSQRLVVNIYLYERAGYDNIEAARARIFRLLHKKTLTPINGGTCWQVLHSNDIPDQEDQALRCPMGLTRFAAIRGRDYAGEEN
jgi:hypothetical protein